MSDPYIGEIKLFGGNFAPVNWAFCNGQLLAIRDHEALFGLIGITYGGDGRTTFGLPDFRGRIPVHSGGNSTPPYNLGERWGEENHTLTVNEIPNHTHTMNAAPTVTADSGSPFSAVSAVTDGPGSRVTNLYGSYDKNTAGSMANEAMTNGGGGSAHINMMPSITVSFIICTKNALFPPRN